MYVGIRASVNTQKQFYLYKGMFISLLNTHEVMANIISM